MKSADSKSRKIVSLWFISFVLLFFLYPLSLAGLFWIHVHPVLLSGDFFWSSFLTFEDLSPLNKVVAVLCWLGMLAPLVAFTIVLVSLVKCRRFWGVLGRTCFMALCLLFFWPVFCELALGATHFLSARQYSDFAGAVEAREPERAIRIADSLKVRRPAGYYDYGLRAKSVCQGLAHELDGEYETARQCYGDCDLTPGSGTTFLYSCHARVFYKEGKLFEAFQAYCGLAELAMQTRNDFLRLSVEPSRADEICAQLAKRRVLLWDGKRSGAPIAPFDDYDAFLTFIESEYEKVEEPEAYKSAVDFWREIAPVDIAVNAPLCRPIDALRKTVGLGTRHMPLHEFCQGDADYLSSPFFWAKAQLDARNQRQ
ncbi:MAG: hypothetical protein IJL92_02800 [Thermoguttaceae bacterium]|nr:hypothetical protein [Thermoguttaceae bacterium]